MFDLEVPLEPVMWPNRLIIYYGNDENMQNNLTPEEPTHVNERNENLLKVGVFLSLLSPCF